MIYHRIVLPRQVINLIPGHSTFSYAFAPPNTTNNITIITRDTCSNRDLDSIIRIFRQKYPSLKVAQIDTQAPDHTDYHITEYK